MCSKISMRLINCFTGTYGPKQDIVYSRCRSKSVSLSHRMIGTFDNELDPEYMLLGTRTPTPAARATRGTSKKVVVGVVTVSRSNEEITLTSTPSRSPSGYEGAPGSKAASCSE